MKNAGEVLERDGRYAVPPLGVTGVTPQENGVTVPTSLLHPLLHLNPGCNTSCNSETGTTTPILVPVTPVTEEAGNDRWTH